MKTVSLGLFFLVVFQLFGQQSFPYRIKLEPKAIDSLVGKHSYVYGRSGNLVLILGGRLDGVHARQPMNAFPDALSNQELMVLNLESGEIWNRGISELSINLQDQLRATNLNYAQQGDTLLFLGGYGYSNVSGTYKTYPYATACIVSNVINHIQNNQSVASDFIQITDPKTANTGGEIGKLGDTLVLVGGHQFDGQYNAMGNPTYTQVYTNAVQPFFLSFSNQQLQLNWLPQLIDANQFHRRDYNLLPMYSAAGQNKLLISSGVFQPTINLPYLYPIELNSTSYIPRTEFSQLLSHYQNATFSLYDEQRQSNHWLFFGGMAQYYYSNGQLIQDNSVPFVKTISRMTLDSTNTFGEFNFPVEMPGYLGAGAEFIAVNDTSFWHDEIGLLSHMTTDSLLLGWIYGGISSPSINPFTNNQTNTTSASNNVYEVWLIKDNSIAAVENVAWNHEMLNLTVYPNPSKDKIQIKLNLPRSADVRIEGFDNSGKLLFNKEFGTCNVGENNLEYNLTQSINESNHFILLGVYVDDKLLFVRKLYL